MGANRSGDAVIVGYPLIFDLRQQTVGRVDYVVLEIDSADGRVAVCKWECAANQYQVAAALERLAAKLRAAVF